MVFDSLPVQLYQAPFQQFECAGGFQPATTFAPILLNTGWGNPESIETHCQAWQSIFNAFAPDRLPHRCRVQSLA